VVVFTRQKVYFAFWFACNAHVHANIRVYWHSCQKTRAHQLLLALPHFPSAPEQEEEAVKENTMKELQLEKMVVNICVGESGDRLTRAAKVRAACTCPFHKSKLQQKPTTFFVTKPPTYPGGGRL
jgi:hypothetical protein